MGIGGGGGSEGLEGGVLRTAYATDHCITVGDGKRNEMGGLDGPLWLLLLLLLLIPLEDAGVGRRYPPYLPLMDTATLPYHFYTTHSGYTMDVLMMDWFTPSTLSLTLTRF